MRAFPSARRYHAVSVSQRVPPGSLITQALPRVDYADTYTITVSPVHSLDSLGYGVFGTIPGWVRRLLDLRNALVKPFGLNTGAERQAATSVRPLEPGTRLAFFPVLARTADELLLGEDDQHLDFRVALRRYQQGDLTCLAVTTTVQFHGWLGRLYFVPVRPFHALIMHQLMRGAAERLGSSQ